MLTNIVKNSFLLCGKNVLLRRNNAQFTNTIAYNIRNKWSMANSKNQSTEMEADDEPIKYSTSKAASMRIDEYRNPHQDRYPWYQEIIISLSLGVFLLYFCILREENDIDLILNTDLEETLNKVHTEQEKK
ncbi:hypothetical protein PUN28_019375 [Cardiocondyla obscurior]|uniref:Uncharacterized protein n=1 Tax=Cardiocondyla obscurior TaxID=286306 RepID=A0AAW2EDZ0_9HYME